MGTVRRKQNQSRKLAAARLGLPSSNEQTRQTRMENGTASSTSRFGKKTDKPQDLVRARALPTTRKNRNVLRRPFTAWATPPAFGL
eukprot:2085363-Lingulodinium_polyedra.AAC.1